MGSLYQAWILLCMSFPKKFMRSSAFIFILFVSSHWGLLTVDPTRRLTTDDLLQNEWIQGQQLSTSTPLMTPDILNSCASIQKRVKATMRAFHTAQREGFLLTDVSNAPLAKRRKKKKDSSTETRSSSSESTHSQSSSSQESTGTTPTPTANPMLTIPVTTISCAPRTTTATGGPSIPSVQPLPSLSKQTGARLDQYESLDSLGFSPILPFSAGASQELPPLLTRQDSGYVGQMPSYTQVTPVPRTNVGPHGVTYAPILDPSMYPCGLQQPILDFSSSIPEYLSVQYTSTEQPSIPMTVPRTLHQPHPHPLPIPHQHLSHLPTISEDPSTTWFYSPA